MNVETLISGTASTWDRDFTIETLNGYEIFYGDTAKEIWGDVDAYSEEGVKLFQAWCAEHNIAYWAAPREGFFPALGAAYARDRGAKYLILEDLS